MNTRRKIAALIGAGALVFAVAGTTFAGVSEQATVSGHASSTAENNNELFWGEDCTKLDAGEGDLGGAVATYVLLHDYTKVIVKAGSEQSAGGNALTIFDNPTAGQFVFADTNGDNTSNPGGQDGDKNISHIIFCGESDTSSSFSDTVSGTTDSTSSSSSSSSSVSDTDTDSDTTSFSGGESGTLTQEPTDTFGGTSSGQRSSATWLLIASLGVLLGSVIVLAPSRAKTRD
jgi:hypothetical protein